MTSFLPNVLMARLAVRHRESVRLVAIAAGRVLLGCTRFGLVAVFAALEVQGGLFGRRLMRRVAILAFVRRTRKLGPLLFVAGAAVLRLSHVVRFVAAGAVVVVR